MEMLLSEVAKVQVDPEHLKPVKLSNKKKAKLRTELIKEYIRSKPYGKRITIEQLAQATNTPSASMFKLINRLVKNGEINQHHLSLRTFFYTVPGTVQHYKVPDITIPKPMERPQNPIFPVTPKRTIVTNPQGVSKIETKDDYSTDKLDASAMRYLYFYPDEDNIRSFIKWLKSNKEG